MAAYSESRAHREVRDRLRREGLRINDNDGDCLVRRYDELNLAIITFGGVMEGCEVLHSLIDQLATRAVVHKGMMGTDYRAAMYKDWFRRTMLGSLAHVLITGRMQVYHTHAHIVTPSPTQTPRAAVPDSDAHITDMTDTDAQIFGARLATTVILDAEP